MYDYVLFFSVVDVWRQQDKNGKGSWEDIKGKSGKRILCALCDFMCTGEGKRLKGIISASRSIFTNYKS